MTVVRGSWLKNERLELNLSLQQKPGRFKPTSHPTAVKRKYLRLSISNKSRHFNVINLLFSFLPSASGILPERWQWTWHGMARHGTAERKIEEIFIVHSTHNDWLILGLGEVMFSRSIVRSFASACLCSKPSSSSSIVASPSKHAHTRQCCSSGRHWSRNWSRSRPAASNPFYVQ